ncbi:hypothetical protein FHS19_004957 [Paenibacillus rhizosphaerae]|uniref:Tetracycline repressor TetR C-terminal domain-containing protein n=1 Tax=Paenibacillus rhizosphaerae TaxID=297318 RepID=A0A839TU58_9BACL|nr:TetR/AcrR family transcriptional regulator C-terminal domain-containing protein [Paenibacillus rhizosphaerae]MBB3130252.1 hypothetical protein [Paenibacillus rhizosphaerae]
MGHAFRRVLHRYRDEVDLFNGGIAMGYHRLLQIERRYQIFASAGFADGHIPWMASMVKNHVLGFVAEEVRLKGMAGRRGSPGPVQRGVRPVFSQFTKGAVSEYDPAGFPYDRYRMAGGI